MVLIGRIIYEKFVNNQRNDRWNYVDFLPTEINTIVNWTAEEFNHMDDKMGYLINLDPSYDF